MYDVSVNSENHRFYTNGILSHNSTSYSIYVLWYIITNVDKGVLICANKQKTSVEILSRIKMAYEMLPSWLKPGVVKWSQTAIEFSNGCKISAEATSPSSGRSMSISCLICDEFAFLPPGVEEAFLQSVFPVVSSSKTSQIILVSTPNGMNNEYYRIYNRATLNLKSSGPSWKAFKINWWEVPGRDEVWHQTQLESFGGDETRFQQEYGNCIGEKSLIEVLDSESGELKKIEIGKLYEELDNE